MLDTIHLRIHDLKTHDKLYKDLIQSTKTIFKRYKLNDDQPLPKKSKRGFLDRDIIQLNNSGRAIEKFAKQSLNVKSSHYSIAISVDPDRDYIDINFSIPKYIYGTNIIQLVGHKHNKGYSGGSEYASWEYKSKKLYYALTIAIANFFHKEFPFSDIDYNKVEINRIDLCFNIVFPNEMEALSYLELQKNIKKKYSRDNTQSKQEYATSLFFLNNDYSFKIYHKGSEYRKNDRKQHDKANKPFIAKGKEAPFPVSDLQNFANRILRCEMTFRSSYMSKLFNQNIRLQKKNNRYVNIKHKNNKKVYDKISSILQKKKMVKCSTKENILGAKEGKVTFLLDDYDYWIKLINQLKNHKTRKGKSTFYRDLIIEYGTRNTIRYGEVSRSYELKALERFHKKFGKFLSKSHKFYLKTDPRTAEEYKHYVTKDTKLEHYDRIPFNEGLLNIMQNKFWETCKEYELLDLPPKNKFEQNMRIFNNSKSKDTERINEHKALLMYTLIQKGSKLSEIRRVLNLPTSTFYRYKRFFDHCGIAEKTASVMYKPTFNFRRYYDEIHLKPYNRLFKRARWY